jgi:hypothetical protein
LATTTFAPVVVAAGVVATVDAGNVAAVADGTVGATVTAATPLPGVVVGVDASEVVVLTAASDEEQPATISVHARAATTNLGRRPGDSGSTCGCEPGGRDRTSIVCPLDDPKHGVVVEPRSKF